MHRLENGRVGADVAAGRHPETADQARDQIGKDVAEEIGGHQHVELPWIEYQLHRAGVDDDGFQDEPSLVLAFVEFQSGFQKDPGQRLHDVGFVNDGHFFSSHRYRMLERELEQAAAALPRVDARGHGHGVRVIVDLNVVLVSDVQALEIFAHDNEVDVVEAAAGDESSRRPQIGIELELLAQPHIRRSITAGGRSLQRPFERQPRALDAVDGLGRKGITGRSHAFQAGGLPIPLKRRAESLQHREGGIHDFGADPVSRDQGGRNGL